MKFVKNVLIMCGYFGGITILIVGIAMFGTGLLFGGNELIDSWAVMIIGFMEIIGGGIIFYLAKYLHKLK